MNVGPRNFDRDVLGVDTSPESFGHGAAQRLRPVPHRQDRPGDIQPALAQAHQQIPGQRGVLGRAFLRCERCLTPSMSTPSATTQQCSPKCTPSIIRATRSTVEIRRHQLIQRLLGGGHKPARHRRAQRARRDLPDRLADRLQAQRVAAVDSLPSNGWVSCRRSAAVLRCRRCRS